MSLILGRLRQVLVPLGAATAVLSVLATPGGPAAGASAGADASARSGRAAQGQSTEYVVLFRRGVTPAAARAAITAAGGIVTEQNDAIGYAEVLAPRTGFAAAVASSGVLVGAAPDQAIARAPQETQQSAGSGRAGRDAVERLTRERARAAADHRSGTTSKAATSKAATSTKAAAEATGEPLADRQWDMRMIGATARGSQAQLRGDRSVLVGVIDTGVDGTHPDIAPNFDAARSRNFVTDDPSIDGPCEYESCVDPANEDPGGHGTHVASTIAAPVNGLGMAGVAPDVTLVNLRAAHDSGYFFLSSTLDALAYAAEIGVDVVNMSFYVDPWLFNCTDNAADSADERSAQVTIRESVQRAIDYVRRQGVLPVAAEGNEATDLNHPTTDTVSPNYPAGASRGRDIDNSCITVPAETDGVVTVSALGPSGRKSYFSNYGTEQTDLAAPGGDYYDSPDNTSDETNLVLGAYPESLARSSGDIDDEGIPISNFIVRDCSGETCGYYQYMQGTSMAAPHAVGVAALLVSRFGQPDPVHGGLTLAAATTEKLLVATATPRACPEPRTLHYSRRTGGGSVVESEAICAGTATDNGFYGRGVVNASRAVSAQL